MNRRVQLMQRWMSLLLIVLICAPMATYTAPIRAQETQPATQNPTQPITPSEPNKKSSDIFTASTSSHEVETPNIISNGSNISDTIKVPRTDEPAAFYDPDLRTKVEAEVAAAAQEQNQPNQPDGSGVILDITAPATYKAGEIITFTYSYNNQTNASADLRLEIVWTEFSHLPSGSAMWCLANGPNCNPQNIQGPSVTYVKEIPSGIEVTVSIPAGANGKFSIGMQTNISYYPGENTPVRRPTTSLRAFVNGNVNPQNRTLSTLLIGPVLSLRKVVLTEGLIYPGESAEFKITLNNASTTVRTDSRDAHNITITDTLPLGSEIVSFSKPFQTSSDGKKIYWELDILPQGTQWEVNITFKRLDVVPLDVGSCYSLVNPSLLMQVEEYPTINGIPQIYVSGAASIGVAIPLFVDYISPTPFLGNNYEAILRVVSFWDQPIQGLRLEYNIQNNASYIGPAVPPATIEPATPDGTIVWVFDMPAGSKSTPSVLEFKIPMKMGSEYTQEDNGAAISLILPANSTVPQACLQAIIAERNSGFGPATIAQFPIRLSILSDLDRPILNGVYIVNRGDIIPIKLQMENLSSLTLTIDDVALYLPGGEGADFSYVANSSFLDGAAFPPASVVNGYNGKITWTNITLSGNATRVISLNVRINDGIDVLVYCIATDAEAQGTIIFSSTPPICVKIVPNLKVTKTVDKEVADIGEEITFQLTLTNNETTPYSAGIVDYYWIGDFTFDRQISGYTDQRTVTVNRMIWERKLLQPGESISVTFVAKVSGDETTRCDSYFMVNEAGYLNPNDLLIAFVPPVLTSTLKHCHQGRYVLFSDTEASLRDTANYRIQVLSLDSVDAINTFTAKVILPLDFSYVGMNVNTSSTPIEPVISENNDGTQTLSWNIPSLEVREVYFIDFRVKTSSTVGLFRSKLIVTSPQTVLFCEGICIEETIESTTGYFSNSDINIFPMITVEPSIIPNGCVTPGSIVTYRVQLFSTHRLHGYPDTVVNVYLPMGLEYIGTTGRRIPFATPLSDGRTLVTWRSLDVPINSNNGTSIVMEMQLRVKNGLADMSTQVEALSDYGLIPLKDELESATSIKICPLPPSVAKMVNKRTAHIGDTLIYQISVSNVNNTDITASIQDQLPANMSFVRMVSGPTPTVSGNMLSWDITVPAVQSQQTQSVTKLIFEAKVNNSGGPLTVYTNTATVSSSSVSLDTTYASAIYTMSKDVYMPLNRSTRLFGRLDN